MPHRTLNSENVEDVDLSAYTEVTVHGLTLNSAFYEFKEIFEAPGFTVSRGDAGYSAVKDGITYRLTLGETPVFNITATVTNRDGIVF